MLREWKLQVPHSEHELVFCNRDGSPLRRTIVLRSGIWPACRRAKLRRYNIKSLRHSFASGLIASGAPITEIAMKMGHASPAVTLKVYSHWFREASTGAAERYAAGFLAALPKVTPGPLSSRPKVREVGKNWAPEGADNQLTA
jgi:integrase